jgi:spermidine synthase
MFKLAPQDEMFNIIEGDAMEFVEDRANHRNIDVLQIDLYDATARGPVLESPEFYRACAYCLTRNGIATINLFGDHPSYRRNIEAICSAFDAVISLPEVHQGNIVAIAFKKIPALDFADLYARAGVIRDITKLPARSWVDGLKSAVSAGSPADR